VRKERPVPLSERDFKALVDVHDFYLVLLKQALGHDVPLPAEVGQIAHDLTGEARSKIETPLRTWLNLLDLAITAPMLRDAFKTKPQGTLPASLLYHYVTKNTHNDVDRDKADFIVTFLFRTPEVSATAWDASGMSFGGVILPPFEAFLLRTLGLTEAPFLPVEHKQLAQEFQFLFEEIEDFRYFDQLIDSGVIQKARDLKHSLGQSFYHPHVLATLASYNVYFGRRFDELFHAATKLIKEFADRLQAEGGSLMARVDGDVIVKQLAEVEGNKILETEYGRAQDQLRMLSKFKKAVDIRKGTKDTAAAAAAAFKQSVAASAPSVKSAPEPTPVSAPLGAALNSSLEEIKFNSMLESIRNIVRAAPPRDTIEVPVRHGTLLLTAAEAEAFRADYATEKSYRADLVNLLMSDVTLLARMATELADFKAKRNSAYLWKPHADSLSHLLGLSQTILQKGEEISDTADKRGLKDKASSIRASMERVREQVQLVAKALQSMGTNQAGTY
jgi:hypothetical protein